MSLSTCATITSVIIVALLGQHLDDGVGSFYQTFPGSGCIELGEGKAVTMSKLSQYMLDSAEILAIK
jgi:hypothetical protein